MTKKIGIILVNYKDYADKFLSACRDSLRAQTYLPDRFQVYIVDNASSYDSQKLLAAIYPEAKILFRQDGNYAAANNFAARYALEDGCDYLVTLNMDTEVEPNWLQELVQALELNPQAGIAQSKILLFPKEKNNEKYFINTLGNKLHFLGFGTTTYYQQPDRLINGFLEIKGYASGCCFIVRKDVFEKINGWNEDYYMYHDDIEFSFKARLAGYKIILAPQSIVFHKYEFSRSIRMLYYMERNRHLFIFSFYSLKLLLLLLPALIFLNSGLFLLAVLNGWWKTWLKANIFFFYPSTWFKIIKTRRQIKNLSQLSFYNFKHDISGTLDFLEINNPLLRYVGNPILSIYWCFIKKVI